jgi:hypothetical protein
MGHTDFVAFSLTGRITAYYESLRWSTWREDVRDLSTERCFMFFPFLWTKEGSPEGSHRSTVPMSETWDMKLDIVRQLMEQS